MLDPSDGLPCGEVGAWARKKHEYLRRYIEISSAARKMFIGQHNAGATFTDLFCNAGRSQIKDTTTIIDGSPLVAWKASQEKQSPFSTVFVADVDDAMREACCTRLNRLGANCQAIPGDAVQAAAALAKRVDHYGLHLAFIDPYSLGALDFRIFQALRNLKRLDLIVHVSAMDLQRNLPLNLKGESDQFDRWAPGWRDAVKSVSDQLEMRARIVEHWKKLIAGLGVWPSTEMRLVKGDQGQRLYWLMLAAKHDLPRKFWGIAANPEGQGSLFS